MSVRPLQKALLFLGLVAPFVGCGSSTDIDSIQLTPATQTLAAGTTVQFMAIGIIGHGSHPSTSQNITATASWTSSAKSVATISATGLATAVGQGTTTITASTPGFGGIITSTATLTVSGGSTGSVVSLSIIPNTQTVLSLNETSQFIAIATGASSGVQIDVTNAVTWGSSDIKVATINGSGLATGLNVGSSTITAIYKNPDTSVVTGTAGFTESANGSGILISTLTVYKVGNNAGTGNVTGAVSGGPIVINCGSGTGCVGNFPLGSTVVLTATPAAGFGGWSANCSPSPNNGPSPSNQCTITLPDNSTVGAIFN